MRSRTAGWPRTAATREPGPARRRRRRVRQPGRADQARAVPVRVRPGPAGEPGRGGRRGGRAAAPGQVPPRPAGGRRPARNRVRAAHRAPGARCRAPSQVLPPRRAGAGRHAARAALRAGRAAHGAGHLRGARSEELPVAETLSAPPGNRAGRWPRMVQRRAGSTRLPRRCWPRPAASWTSEGYETHSDPAGLTLANCPFRALAAEHTALVCGMNLAIMEGLLERLDRLRYAAVSTRPRDGAASGWCRKAAVSSPALPRPGGSRSRSAGPSRGQAGSRVR